MTALEEIRTRLGWSQVQMGERIGLHRNSVAKAEQRETEDKTTWLAARMAALEEASRRGDLSALTEADRGLVRSLVQMMVRGDMAGSTVMVPVQVLDVDAEYRLAGPVNQRKGTP